MLEVTFTADLLLGQHTRMFVDGFAPALWVGAGLSALGVLAALLSPRHPRRATGIVMPATPAQAGEPDASLVAGTQRAS